MAIAPPAAAEGCTPIARLESLQGAAEKLPASHSNWVPIRLGAAFCQHDKLRTLHNTRAAVRLINNTLVRLRQDSTLSFTDIHADRKSLLELLRGALHMLSRTPHPLEIRTPFVNAAIEGTEFTLTAENDASEITVFEGKVIASSEQARLQINPNETGVIRKGAKPVKSLRLRPREAVSWTLYYPAILDCATLDADSCNPGSTYAEVMEQLAQNHPARALAMLEKTGKPSDLQHLIAASIKLTAGDVPAANEHLRAISARPAFQAAAEALRTIIDIARNRLDEADRHLAAALAHDPDSALPWLAGSYLSQARFEIPESLAQARKALTLAPRSATANARVAELLLMNGEVDKARQYADQAIRINPVYSHNLALLGFASLRERASHSALSAFHQAIELDSGDPLGHFGLGLVEIRRNRMTKGREKLELATLLDPGSALLRSYLGKAYYEENRPSRSAAQYRLAQQLDPNDPTAWFYSAILLQSLNRPVNAWRALEHSIVLNDNRGVYRSRMLLDEDAAARSASLGRIYGKLGFERLATRQASGALQISPGEYAAHRLLADSYLPFSDLDSARKSELLQAQMLQPLNHFPLQSPLADVTTLLDGAGPGAISFNEYNPMFIHEGATAELNAVGGDRGLAGDDLTLSWLNRRLSLTARQSHFETDGARINQDYRINSYEWFAQGRVTRNTTAQLALREDVEQKGDVSQPFFDEDRNPDIRIRRDIRGGRIGLAHRASGHSQWLLTATRKTQDERSSSPIGYLTEAGDTLAAQFQSRRRETIKLLDLQYQRRADYSTLLAGASYNGLSSDTNAQLNFGSQPCPISSCDLSPEPGSRSQRRLYGYLYYSGWTHRRLTLALTYKNNAPADGGSRTDHWFPKLGLSWRIGPRHQLRAAVFRAMNPAVNASQFQSLEPTQINGFNQVLDNQSASADIWSRGLGLKTRLAPGLMTDLEWLDRDIEARLDTTVFSGGGSNNKTVDLNTHSASGKAFIYWTPNDAWSLGAGYVLESRKTDDAPAAIDQTKLAPDGLRRLTTRALPLSLRWFHRSGVSASASAAYYRQNGDFIGLKEDDQPRAGHDSFWMLDVALSWQPTRRRGKLTLGVKNLLDQRFRFHDIHNSDSDERVLSATPSRLAPRRQIYGSVSWRFR